MTMFVVGFLVGVNVAVWTPILYVAYRSRM